MINKHFRIAAGIAFVGIILLFNVDSAFADKHNINAVFGIGGALCLAAAVAWIGYRYIKQGGNPNRRK